MCSVDFGSELQSNTMRCVFIWCCLLPMKKSLIIVKLINAKRPHTHRHLHFPCSLKVIGRMIVYYHTRAFWPRDDIFDAALNTGEESRAASGHPDRICCVQCSWLVVRYIWPSRPFSFISTRLYHTDT